MYRNIMVAVDLGHLDALEKSLKTAGDMARHFGASVTYVSVGATYPTVGHNPHDFAQKLRTFAEREAATYEISTRSHPMDSADPPAELDGLLLEAIEATDADLVIMGSHRPGLAEYFFSSNAGYVATHAPVSVMVVR